jgi:hypothetical protein
MNHFISAKISFDYGLFLGIREFVFGNFKPDHAVLDSFPQSRSPHSPEYPEREGVGNERGDDRAAALIVVQALTPA